MATPVLIDTFEPSLGSVLEGATDPAGITVADLVVDGSITAGGVEAIAVEAVDTSLGTWQYSLDAGASWLTIHADLLNSSINTLGLLLGPNNLLRLLPFGDLNGTLLSAITFRAWDMSSGSAGDYVLTTPGLGAFSAASDTAGITVTAVNDAPSFAPVAGTGIVVTDVGNASYDQGLSVVVQADGTILVAGVSFGGSADFAVVRYLADGSLDTNFGVGGKVVTDFSSSSFDSGQSLIVQPDGKIVVAGVSDNGDNNDFALARYNTDGSLDTSFDVDGKVVTDFSNPDFMDANDVAQSITQGPDGKIWVAGFREKNGDYDFAVARYSADGTQEVIFGGDLGGLNDVAYGVTVQPDGKVQVAGYSDSIVDGDGVPDYNFALLRYNADATQDEDFGVGGILLTDFGTATHDPGHSVVVQPDGKILVAGHTFNGVSADFAVVRYLADGSLDTSFDGDGKVAVDFGGQADEIGQSLTLQPDGKILVAGFSFNNGIYDFALARYNADGSLDTSFNGTGVLVTDIGGGTDDDGRSVTVQPDGKIVVAGYSDSGSGIPSPDFAMVRYNADGSLDTTFSGVATDTLGGSVDYFENAAAVALDASVAIYDADLAALAGGAGNYNGASITLNRNTDANPEDLFSALGNLSFIDGAAVLSGTTVGTVINDGGQLTITFNADATQVRVNGTLSSIGYANSSDAPPASVQINWSFSDGNSGAQGADGPLSAFGSTTVNIAALPELQTGTAGNDTLVGTAIDDVLYGFGGNDSLSGLAGNDVLDGGTGRDSMAGGADNDSYWVDNTKDTVTESSDAGTDEVFASINYTLGANVEHLTLVATAGAINGTGNELDNALNGNSAANVLNGGAGSDAIFGDGGNDLLIGGLGSDSLNGGDGLDAFRFNTALGPTNVDTIANFVVADDVIQLDHLIFTALPKGKGKFVFTDAQFVTGTAALDASDRIIYDNETGALLYDADGTGTTAAAVQFATLGIGLVGVVTAADFVVV